MDSLKKGKSMMDRVSSLFFKVLWSISETTGIGLHKIGISPAYVFGRAFGREGKEVDSLGRKL
jgi:hypothetical protein